MQTWQRLMGVLCYQLEMVWCQHRHPETRSIEPKQKCGTTYMYRTVLQGMLNLDVPPLRPGS